MTGTPTSLSSPARATGWHRRAIVNQPQTLSRLTCTWPRGPSQHQLFITPSAGGTGDTSDLLQLSLCFCPSHPHFFFFFLVALGFELRALQLLGRRSILPHAPCFGYVIQPGLRP
jgi:hypothetical protein